MLPELEVLVKIVLSVFDLAKGTFPFAVLFFFLAFPGMRFKEYLQKKFKFSWVLSVLIVVFVFSFVLSSVAYLLPFLISSPAVDLGVVPEEMLPVWEDVFSAILISVFKIFFLAVFLAFFTMPFLFLASFVSGYLNKKKFNRHVALFAASFTASFFAFAVLFYFFYWIIPGIVYFLYSS